MRSAFIAIAALAVTAFTAGPAAADADSGCGPRAAVVWEHVADNGTADLLLLTCHGARQLTHTPAGEGGSELPRWGRHGDVYFDSDQAGLIHLFRLNVKHGSDVEQLTDTVGVEFGPTTSPSGRQLVFEHADAEGTGDGLFIAPNRPGLTEASFHRLTLSPTAATGGFDGGPDVSPAGSVAFIRTLDATTGSARSAVFTIGLDGRGLRQLTPYSLNAVDVRWSPDGRWLTFSSNGDNFSATVSANVYVVRKDGSKLNQITHEPPGHQSFAPDWAGADRIVFSHAELGVPGTQLRTMRLDGTHQAILYQGHGGTELNADWQPGG
jgi:Tol biopolymer transport system component